MKGILSEITVSVSDTGLKNFGGPIGDMITDGSWAVRRESLKRAVKPPPYILAELVKTERPGAKLDELAPAFPNGIHNDFCALEVQDILISELRNKVNTLLVPLYECEGDMVVYANARVLKLITGMFPRGAWYAARNEPNKPLMLVEHFGGEAQIAAILMPYVLKNAVPTLRAPSAKKVEKLERVAS